MLTTEQRWFPVHPCDRKRLEKVPWSLLELHEPQAIHNHDQSLERLASRGGLSLCEMRAVIADKGYFDLTQTERDAAEEFIRALLKAEGCCGCGEPR